MVLTSSYQRRTAGFTALFAAVLLILTALFAISPASADSHTGTCKDVEGYDDNIVGDSSGDWGSIDHTADGPITLNVNDGYTLRLCLKKGSEASGAGAVDTGPYVGPIVDQVVRYGDGDGLSHYSYRVVDTPTTDASASIEQDCPTQGDGPADSTVSLDNTGSNLATTFRIDADDAEPVFVEVAAGDTDTVELSGDYVLVRWFDVDEDIRKSVDAEFDGECLTTAPAAEITINCDVAQIYLDNTGSDVAVTYTITGADGYDTVEVPAGSDQTLPLTIAEDADYDITVSADGMDDATAAGTYNCEGVEGSETDPAGSVTVTCEVAQIVLDNTGSDVAVTYTITGVDGYDTVEVPAGEQQVIDDLGIDEDADYDITVSAEGMDDATAAGTYDCVTPTTEVDPDEVVKTPTPDVVEVSPDVVEKPAPDPAPTAEPAAQAAAQELPATGLGSTELLLLALLMLGLGTAALLGSDPRRQN